MFQIQELNRHYQTYTIHLANLAALTERRDHIVDAIGKVRYNELFRLRNDMLQDAWNRFVEYGKMT
jgi:hypothetical protein